MKIIKRDGTIQDFDRNKIVNAVLAAFKDVDGTITQYASAKAQNIADYAEAANRERCADGKSYLSVEEIQDIAERGLMSLKRKDVAKSYILYREERSREREKNSKIIQAVNRRNTAKNIENSNANVDERSFSGREKEASSDVQKIIALDYVLSKDVAQAHKDMLLYQHDLEKTNIGQHNCLNIDFKKLLSEGFTTRNGDIRSPASFSAACQLYAVIFQCQSQVQFGGVGSVHIDYDLAPYVRKSFAKYYRDGLKYLCNIGENQTNDEIKGMLIKATDWSVEDGRYKAYQPKVYAYAMDMLEREGRQAMEALYHNLNTLESRAGSQVPFTSLNIGRDISAEGRMVTRWMLEASIDGIGKHHLTPIFPISIFQYKSGVNAEPGTINYDLKQLALQSLSRRIYPNFVNCDWSQAHEDPNDIDSMFSTINTVA